MSSCTKIRGNIFLSYFASLSSSVGMLPSSFSTLHAYNKIFFIQNTGALNLIEAYRWFVQ